MDPAGRFFAESAIFKDVNKSPEGIISVAVAEYEVVEEFSSVVSSETRSIFFGQQSLSKMVSAAIQEFNE